MIWPFKKTDKGWDERDLESILDKYWKNVTRPDAIIEMSERESKALSAHVMKLKAKASA
jgi:hypothetical protein